MFGISDELARVQLEATLARINLGTGRAAWHIYTNARPASCNVAPGQTAQAVIELATPVGSITAGVLSLIPASTSGAIVQADGIPRWGRLVAADGAVLTDGNVTDPLHGGDIQLIGGKTPAGDNSPMLYAGGLVLLGTVALT